MTDLQIQITLGAFVVALVVVSTAGMYLFAKLRQVEDQLRQAADGKKTEIIETVQMSAKLYQVSKRVAAGPDAQPIDYLNAEAVQANARRTKQALLLRYPQWAEDIEAAWDQADEGGRDV